MTNVPKQVWRAWFSAKQAASIGTVVYAREDGTKVEITEVTPLDSPVPMCSDAEDLGEVVRYVRGVQSHMNQYTGRLAPAFPTSLIQAFPASMKPADRLGHRKPDADDT